MRKRRLIRGARELEREEKVEEEKEYQKKKLRNRS